MPTWREVHFTVQIYSMTDQRPLTPRQHEVLRVIERALARDGYPPTRAEIAQALGFSSANAAQDHLQALQRKGRIALDGSHRGIRVMAPAPAAPASKSAEFLVPLIGRVAAGAPILASAHVEAQFTLDPALFHPRPQYLLRVRGLSMRDAGLLDGDLVAVHAAREARNGQIVVVRLGDEATVKIFERRGERVRLLPANPDFAPIEVERRQSPVIEGIVVGVVRRAMQEPPFGRVLRATPSVS